jgi:chlorobactene glucosyltransferase
MARTRSSLGKPHVARAGTWLSVAQHLTALLLLAWLSRRLRANLLFLRDARRSVARLPEQGPRVSVLVPARNEAATIGACLTSLLQQRYPNVEVLVLDDGSTDGTGEEIDALQARYPQLRVFHRSDEPPPGWTGKNYACARLATLASGEWLLFTDADTLHTPSSIEQGLAQALALDAALLSAFPAQRAVTWSERLLVSFVLDFLPLVAVDLRELGSRSGRNTKTRVVANGQYLLVRAEAYRAVGGHASISTTLIDDFALARRFRDHSYSVVMVDGTPLLSCRMYSSAGQVWQGFSKNLLGALSAPSEAPTSPPAVPVVHRLASRGSAALAAAAFAWGYACLFVLPIVNLLRGRFKALACGELCWLLLLRAAVVWRLRRPLDEIVSTPLAAWTVMALGLTTLWRRWRGQRVAWKGRLY